jgi:dTDP-4-amino-4,6-dideoxygalactose transaminase
MIPFFDLDAQHVELRDEIRDAVQSVLDSGRYVLGEPVTVFEEKFAAYCGVRYGVAVNSGTSALQLALLAAGVGPGDEVVTTPFSFLATAAAIEFTGAKPVFVDIDPISFNLDPALLRSAIGPRTKAILPVHLYGQPAEMDEILTIAREHDLVVIEDAAQAHGACYGDRHTGALGDMGCFSFYPSKNLGACGEGGIVVTDNADWAHAVRVMRDWGQDGKHRYVRKGQNSRMSTIQGAVLRVKLKCLDRWNRQRRERAAEYGRLLAAADVVCPAVLPGRTHVYHVYVVRAARRDRLRQELASRGVGSEIHYPLPIHRIQPWTDERYKLGDFPNAERAAMEVLSLPMYPELPPEAVSRVAETVIEAAGAE